MLRYLPYLLVITLWIFAFVDCLGTPEREVRGLPKVVWVLIILFFGEVLVGPIAWLVAGRRRGAVGAGPGTSAGAGAGAAGAEQADGLTAPRLGRRPDGPLTRPRTTWVAPDDNPEFLRSLSDLNRQNRKDGGPSSPDPE